MNDRVANCVAVAKGVSVEHVDVDVRVHAAYAHHHAADAHDANARDADARDAGAHGNAHGVRDVVVKQHDVNGPYCKNLCENNFH